MMRVIIVEMDRLHVDPETDAFSDDARVERGRPVRGTRLSMDVAAYTLLALRTARRSLGSALTLYGNTTADTQGIHAARVCRSHSRSDRSDPAGRSR